MEIQLLPDVAADKRVDYLKDTCDKVEDFHYMKRFEHNDLELFKNKLSDAMIELNAMEEELTAKKAEYKEKMDPYKETVKENLKLIRDKALSIKEKCFVIYAHEENMAGYYNQYGELVHSRPLLPIEKQRTIMSMLRTGTDDVDIND